jgi:hypothetical protein
MIQVFYHVACMNHWREIVSEHFRLLEGQECHVKIGFSGSRNDSHFLYHTATSRGISHEVLFTGVGLHTYEMPTLEALHEYCRNADADEPVAYIHTKGASKPGDWHSMMWRWWMNTYIPANLSIGVNALRNDQTVDWVAPLAGEVGTTQHSCGNFWTSRAGHIARLPKISIIRADQNRNARYGIPQWHKHERFIAEWWIGTVRGKSLTLHPSPIAPHIHKWWASNPDAQQEFTRRGS